VDAICCKYFVVQVLRKTLRHQCKTKIGEIGPENSKGVVKSSSEASWMVAGCDLKIAKLSTFCV
jgi:hypothetical protein